MTNISNIVATLEDSGIHKPSLYRVSIELPSEMDSGWNTVLRNMKPRVHTATIPQEEIRTYERPSHSRTIQRVVSGRAENEPIMFSVIASNDLRERKLFETWMDYAVDRHTNMPRFFDKYIGSMKIDLLSVEEGSDDAFENGRIVSRYHLYDVFPSGLGEIELGYANTDEFTTFTVTITYHRWMREDKTSPTGRPDVF